MLAVDCSAAADGATHPAHAQDDPGPCCIPASDAKFSISLDAWTENASRCSSDSQRLKTVRLVFRTLFPAVEDFGFMMNFM